MCVRSRPRDQKREWRWSLPSTKVTGAPFVFVQNGNQPAPPPFGQTWRGGRKLQGCSTSAKQTSVPSLGQYHIGRRRGAPTGMRHASAHRIGRHRFGRSHNDRHHIGQHISAGIPRRLAANRPHNGQAKLHFVLSAEKESPRPRDHLRPEHLVGLLKSAGTSSANTASSGTASVNATSAGTAPAGTAPAGDT
ncbi:unnamed protein product [Cuscuta epithymum]|uniref:Uncharacterized protein n=1 Tax=Cuscuta epithymum TaxID=186058 RepID=A0AAV0FQB7_9ASTE|nr:unnamed protein product [Cuscuta epithymum]